MSSFVLVFDVSRILIKQQSYQRLPDPQEEKTLSNLYYLKLFKLIEIALSASCFYAKGSMQYCCQSVPDKKFVIIFKYLTRLVG